MIFSTYEFLFLFLPIVLAVYFLTCKIFKGNTVPYIFLTGASLFFYGYFKPAYLWIISVSIIVNYTLAVVMQRTERSGLRRFALTAGILFNIGLLGYYKYLGFFTDTVNKLYGANFTVIHLLLPLGISFFTFQQFSFLISVFKREERADNFPAYCLFVTFFPQLVAGPIVIYSEMIPQFLRDDLRWVNYGNIAKGLYIFALGMFKKLVIADTAAILADSGYAAAGTNGFIAAWVTTFAYSMQIYFDFSAYSDMAIGLGNMFNIELPVNFNSPYKADSISDFWRRWHITLGRALTNMVYIPLGGNRGGKARTCLNILCVFFVSGLWHGAGWTFVLWGLAHGVVRVLELLLSGKSKQSPQHTHIRIFLTFMFVNAAWVLFRSPNLQVAGDMYREMFTFSSIFSGGLGYIHGLKMPLYLLGLTALLAGVFFCKNTAERAKKYTTNRRYLVTTVILMVTSVLHMSRISPFIYFNF